MRTASDFEKWLRRFRSFVLKASKDALKLKQEKILQPPRQTKGSSSRGRPWLSEENREVKRDLDF